MRQKIEGCCYRTLLSTALLGWPASRHSGSRPPQFRLPPAPLLPWPQEHCPRALHGWPTDTQMQVGTTGFAGPVHPLALQFYTTVCHLLPAPALCFLCANSHPGPGYGAGCPGSAPAAGPLMRIEGAEKLTKARAHTCCWPCHAPENPAGLHGFLASMSGL